MEKNKLEKLMTSVDKLLKFFSDKQELKFESQKVKDSEQVVEYTALEVGADVSVSTASGSEVAPDGSYTLANDVAFTVKDGKIESIENTGDTPAEDEPKAEELAEPETEATPAEPAKDDAVKALEDKVAALEATIKTIQDSMSAAPSKTDVAELNKELKNTFSKIEDLAKIPTQLSVDNRIEVKEDAMDKYKMLAERYSK